MDAFELWYEGYPHKVARGAAEKAFATALGKASLAELIEGRDRYIRDKPPDIAWCNPATWLNAKRWTDKPQHQTGMPANGPRPDHHPGSAASRSEDRMRRIVAGSEIAARIGGYDLGG